MKNTNNLTHREEINLHEAVQKSFPKILIKDLTEYERICPVCNGLGMRIEDNIMEQSLIVLKLVGNIIFHTSIKHFHFVGVVLMEYRDYVLIVDSLIRIRDMCIVIVKDRRKLMKKRE